MKKKHPTLYRLWCIFFLNKLFYYPELNSKRSKSNKISNVFYNIRILNKYTKKVSKRQYNTIIFYYVNKLVFCNYPYFYWTYMFVYNKYNYNPNASKKSQNIKAHIFFFLINEFNKFTKSSTKKSFSKFDFYTFKGIKKSLRQLDKIKKQTFLITKKKFKDRILTKVEDHLKLVDKNFIKSYFIVITKPKIINHKFYIHSIIYNNLIKFMTLTDTTLVHIAKIFKIKWYNKIQNSTASTFKNNLILFLRSSKHFNKGRYSRNRQLYRTGVYWCIWLNIIIVYSLYFYFYRIVYSFGYVWIPLGLIILSIFSSRIYKYRYYNFNQVKIEFKEFSNFLIYLFYKIWYIYIDNIKSNLTKFITFFINYYKLLYIFIILWLNSVLRFFKKIIP